MKKPLYTSWKIIRHIISLDDTSNYTERDQGEWKMTINLSICNQAGKIKKAHQSHSHAYLGFKEAYIVGDTIQINLDTENNYLVVDLDATLKESLIFVPGKEWRYEILAFGAETAFYSTMFHGERHYLSVRYATDCEINAYRNLALNPHDQKTDTGAYPHASANVETRNDSTFFARNAIDGILANDDHGSYPFQSWGINQDPDACLRIDFGRQVEVDQLGIVLRGDFPHDSYWNQGKVTFSDGSDEQLYFEKVLSEQRYPISKRKIEWLEFSELIKQPDDSPFPALTQIMVYGRSNS